MTAVFQITNGTTTIDFLNSSGYDLISWRPSIASYKDGGVFTDNKMATGRKPVFRQYGNLTETILFGLYGTNQDSVIDNLQSLTSVMDRAFSYWLPGSQETAPFYLVVRATAESNTRYALIYKGEISGFSDPYYESMTTGILVNGTVFGSGISNLTLNLELGLWTGNAPGTGTAVQTSAVETFNSLNFGDVDSSGTRTPHTNGTYVANKGINANLTHIYRYDSSAGTYSSNLVNSSVPFNLFPSPAGNGDILYIGIQTSVTDVAPFAGGVIFDITQAAAGTHTIVWEYFTGIQENPGTWTTITALRDNTDSSGVFRVTGINGIFFRPPQTASETWYANSINSVTAFWIRARISAFTSMTTIPQQGNRKIYAVSWPYVEIQSTEVGGDIPALARIKATNKSDAGGVNGVTQLFINHLFVGLRAYSRGASFRPHINIAGTDDNNPSGISVSGVAAGDPGYSNGITYNHGGSQPSSNNLWADRFVVTIDNTISGQYSGNFRAFLRVFVQPATAGTVTAGAISVRLRVRCGSGGSDLYSKIADCGYNQWSAYERDMYELLDLGQIQIPTLSTFDAISIGIQMKLSSSEADNASVNTHDLILMPVDEFACWCSDANPTNNNSHTGRISSVDGYLDIDSITNPRQPIAAMVKKANNDQIYALYKSPANSSAILANNSQQRLFFLSARQYVSTGTTTSATSTTVSDTSAHFVDEGIQVNDLFYNTTAGTIWTITAVTATQLTITQYTSGDDLIPSGGENYYIITRAIVSDPWSCLQVQLFKNQRYLIFRGNS